MTLTPSPPGYKTADDLQASPRQSWLTARGLVPDSGPRRILALGTFVNMLGSGVFMASAALFFTHAVGLSVYRVGIGLGIAAVVGLFAGVPVGHIADRRGPKQVYVLMLLVQAVAMAGLVFVRSFWLFVIAVCVTELASSASSAARGPLVRGFGGPNLTKYRSYLRSVANLAGSFGAIGAGLAVQIDTRNAYLGLVIANAVSFVACAAIMVTLPSLPPVPKPIESDRWIALKDRAYVAVTALDGVLWIQGEVLVFALPLWIVGSAHVPRWFVGLAVLLNTSMVVLLQVRASRGVETSAAGARAMRRAGVAFLIGMALIAVTAHVSTWIAVFLILLGIAVHTVGELWHAAGSLELRYRLAPAHAQGQYSGVFGFGMGLANVVSPTLLAVLCISWGTPGWLVLGVVFVGVGAAMPAVVRWAERTRPFTADEAS